MLSARVRRWRNWYTRQLEVLVGATPWKFESSLPHHSLLNKVKDLHPKLLAESGLTTG